MNRRTDERPAPLCANYPEVYDALDESSRGDNREAWETAQQTARNLCGTCLLRTPDRARKCLSDNRGERWRNAVLGRELIPAAQPKPQRDPRDRPSVAESNQQRARLFHDERLADLRAFIDAGTPLEQIVVALGLTRNGLHTWCMRHKHLDLWRIVSPPREPAVVSSRRRRAA